MDYYTNLLIELYFFSIFALKTMVYPNYPQFGETHSSKTTAILSQKQPDLRSKIFRLCLLQHNVKSVGMSFQDRKCAH